MSGYCLPDYKPTAPSNRIKNPKDLALDKAPSISRKKSGKYSRKISTS